MQRDDKRFSELPRFKANKVWWLAEKGKCIYLLVEAFPPRTGAHWKRKLFRAGDWKQRVGCYSTSSHSRAASLARRFMKQSSASVCVYVWSESCTVWISTMFMCTLKPLTGWLWVLVARFYSLSALLFKYYSIIVMQRRRNSHQNEWIILAPPPFRTRTCAGRGV